MFSNLVIMLLMDTPVPIPNTKVKHQEADSTARAAVWEGRLLPGQCSAIAQRWSTRLLTDRLEVRILFAEPFLMVNKFYVGN